MSPEHDAALCKKYPEIFKNRNADMTATAMCWGFECDDGWYALIDTLCSSLMGEVNYLRRAVENKYHKPDEIEKLKKLLAEAEAAIPVASQVKEKYGGLRFYVEYSTDKQDAFIDFAESLSYRICEVCGSMHDTQSYSLGWVKTLCPTHADERYGEEAASEYREKNARR